MGPPRAAVGEQVDVAQSTLLSAADCDFVKEFQDSLSKEAANGRDCGGLLTAILYHLDHFKEQIHAEGAGNERDQHDCAGATFPPVANSVWGAVIAEAHTSRGVSKVTITGPGPEDRFQVPVSSPEDASRTVAFVAGVDAACRTIKDMHNHCDLIIQKRQDLETGQSRLKQAAESTVNEHIRLLRQYNKVKDVGQQLIGLNAENRGVPVRSLYADDQYGVGSND